MRIWHDNSGKGKFGCWYLNYVVVRDIQTKQKYHFIVNQWLAVEEDDGQVSICRRCVEKVINYHKMWHGHDHVTIIFNVRQSYCVRYSYKLDVCPSVRPSVRHTMVLCRNG